MRSAPWWSVYWLLRVASKVRRRQELTSWCWFVVIYLVYECADYENKLWLLLHLSVFLCISITWVPAGAARMTMCIPQARPFLGARIFLALFWKGLLCSNLLHKRSCRPAILHHKPRQISVNEIVVGGVSVSVHFVRCTTLLSRVASCTTLDDVNCKAQKG